MRSKESAAEEPQVAADESMPQAEFDLLAELLSQGQYDELERASRDAGLRFPRDGRSWQLLGVAFLAREDYQQALGFLTRASELAPNNAAIWDNLGLTFFRLRDFRKADSCFARSASIQPDLLTTWINWSANSCSAGDPQGAEQQALRALQLNRYSAEGWLNFGNALLELDRPDEAERAYLNALKLQPGLIEAQISYGMLLDARGKLDEARRMFERVLVRSPGNWRACANLGKILSTMGCSADASACYRDALQSKDATAEVYSGLLFLRLYEEDADVRSIVSDHLAFGDRFETSFRGQRLNHPNRRDADRRLRIGFVSGDFRYHPVSHFFEPFLLELDRSQFEVILYSNHPTEDSVSQRLKLAADGWVKVAKMSDEELAEKICSDQIDILVDLAGHGSYNRLPVFARRPAPVQVSWLGYPATTGLTTIDYRPVFSSADPDRTLGGQFSEKLVYVSCAPTFRNPVGLPDVTPLPAAARGYLTFANMNRSDKLGDAVIRAWSRILLALPESRFIVGAISNESVGRSIAGRFAANGVSADRLELCPRLRMQDYLSLHGEIDILLDPFPFSGLTTSEHAIRMGVPVVTLAGESLVSRQGLVVMNSVGLGDWVARTIGEYETKAVEFGRSLDCLASIRLTLRSRAIDGAAGYLSEAVCMGRAFREMWRRWCEGRRPESFDVL